VSARDIMTAAAFLARYRATAADLQAYVNGLPLWVNVWRGWMFIIFTAAVVFVIWKREARWLALTMIVSLFAYNLVSMVSGVGRFPSVAFVVFWSPLALYLWRRRAHLAAAGRFDQVYAWWLKAAVGTLCISLAFDAYNVAYSLIAGVP
jgi:branched-subunit amino acid transport protein AzlD